MRYRRTALFLFLGASLALLLVACKVPEDLANTVAVAVGNTVAEKLGALLAAGTITDEAYKLAMAALQASLDAGKQAAMDQGLAFDSTEAMKLGGVFVSSILGTSALSRWRRGYTILTGKEKPAS